MQKVFIVVLIILPILLGECYCHYLEWKQRRLLEKRNAMERQRLLND